MPLLNENKIEMDYKKSGERTFSISVLKIHGRPAACKAIVKVPTDLSAGVHSTLSPLTDMIMQY